MKKPSVPKVRKILYVISAVISARPVLKLEPAIVFAGR